jgi:hypothetical protein
LQWESAAVTRGEDIQKEKGLPFILSLIALLVKYNLFIFLDGTIRKNIRVFTFVLAFVVRKNILFYFYS